MKFALVTTTINVPHVLKLYRACSTDVRFFVVGDRKTPKEAYEFALTLDNTQISMPESGHQWKCSELIGWNCIQRRNIGFLEALKWGAGAVLSIDDDNIPIDTSYFSDVRLTLGRFDGVAVRGKYSWIDPGQYLRPTAKHRGFPNQAKHETIYEPIVDAEVGVVAGMCLSDPDIDATTRMVNAPDVQQVSQLVENGIVVHHQTWTVFNSQNTAILREFLPAWFMWNNCGRMDDIYSSLVVQRVMRERGYCVHLGKPFVVQQRNQHDLVKDLRAELDGYDNVIKLSRLLDELPLLGKSVIEDCRRIWDLFGHTPWVPEQTVKAAFAWLDDCETVM